jgi:hypothetical protein
MKSPTDQDTTLLRSLLRGLSRANPYRLRELDEYAHNLTDEEEEEIFGNLKTAIERLPLDRLTDLSDHIINLIDESSD